MKTIKVSPLSVASFYTEVFHNSIQIGTATSFAYLYKNEKFLITNYHVAYGKNPENGNVLNKMGALPNKIIVHFRSREKSNPDLLFLDISFNENENPFKYVGMNNRIVDIAIFKLPKEFCGVCINELETVYNEPSVEESIKLQITEQLYVLGYPRGIQINNTPIWKKSSIAPEPDLEINDMPCFYIDSTTREGMSGAPVVYYSKDGIYSGGEIAFAVADRPIYKFVGIYSGRDRNDESHIAQLGKVWKKELIERIIEDNY